jgi:hypothetical protein
MVGSISIAHTVTGNGLPEVEMLVLLCNERAPYRVSTYYVPRDYRYAGDDAVLKLLGPVEEKLVPSRSAWGAEAPLLEWETPDIWLSDLDLPTATDLPAIVRCYGCDWGSVAWWERELPDYCAQTCEFGHHVLSSGLISDREELLRLVICCQEGDINGFYESFALPPGCL